MLGGVAESVAQLSHRALDQNNPVRGCGCDSWGPEGIQYIMAGKAWRPEQEVAGHVASTVRKQSEMDARAQLTVSFYFAVQDPSP